MHNVYAIGAALRGGGVVAAYQCSMFNASLFRAFLEFLILCTNPTQPTTKIKKTECLPVANKIHNFEHLTMEENVYLTGIDNNYPTNHQPMYNHRIFNHRLFDFIMRWHFLPSLSSFLFPSFVLSLSLGFIVLD